MKNFDTEIEQCKAEYRARYELPDDYDAFYVTQWGTGFCCLCDAGIDWDVGGKLGMHNSTTLRRKAVILHNFVRMSTGKGRVKKEKPVFDVMNMRVMSFELWMFLKKRSIGGIARYFSKAELEHMLTMCNSDETDCTNKTQLATKLKPVIHY